MIVKLHLDSESLKRGLVEHFEKVLFGLIVLFCLLLVYRAIAREGRLTWGPNELEADSRQAKARVQDAHNINAKMPVGKIFVATSAKVVDGPYLPQGGLVLAPGSPLSGGLSRRGMPKLFPVKDLQVAGGHGKFAMSSEDEMQAPAMGDAMGSGSMMGNFKGQRWVVVTAVIDYKKQREAYEAVFQYATYRSPTDLPEYRYFYVERAEVDPLNPSAPPKWVRLKTTEAMDVTLYWNAIMPELVDPMLIPPPAVQGDGTQIDFAFPLGPLQDRMWGPEVAHPPEIPLLSAEMSLAGGPMAGSTMYAGMGGMYPGMAGAASARPAKKTSAKPGEEEVAVEELAEPASEMAKMREAQRKAYEKRLAAIKALKASRPDTPAGAGAAGGTAGMGDMGPSTGYPGRMSRGASGPGMMPMPGPGMSGMSGMMSGMGSRRSGMPSRSMSSDDAGSGSSYFGAGGPRRASIGYGSQAAGDATFAEEYEEPNVLLFRFFDFKVAEGKQYRYRVQLVVANPNFGVNPQYLERDELGAKEFLNNGPVNDSGRVLSDPSPIVTVPRDSQALVVSAKGAAATLMMVHFDYETGETSFEEVASIQRGQLLNARNRESSAATRSTMTDPMSPDSASMMGSMSMGSMPTSPYRPARPEEKKTVDYLTETVFLDAAGGGTLPGKEKKKLEEPSLALFLDPDGNLFVRSELDDQAEVEIYKPPEGQGRPGLWSGSEGYPMPGMYGNSDNMDDATSGKKSKKGSDKGGSKASRFQSGVGSGMMPGGYGPGTKGSASGPPAGYPMPKASGSGRMPSGMMPMPGMDMDAAPGAGKRSRRQ